MKKAVILLLFLILLIWIISISQKSLTPKEVIEQKDLLIGKSIDVTGKADVSSIVRCTLMFCSEDNPCCNSCSGDLILTNNNEKIVVRGTYGNKSIECFGNGCEMSCYPLERNRTYKVNGVLKKEFSEYHLQLTSFRLIE